MDGWTCDRCGKTLLVDEDVRYVAKIRVFAPYDVLEVSRADLERRDLSAEMERVLERAARLTAEEAQDQVYRELEFDLCPPCQTEFLRDPLGRGRRV